MSEIRIHKSLNHKNIVSFDHFFEDGSSIYILLGICRNQTIHELLERRKRLTEIEARCYIIQLISGLKYLHKQHIIHRDLKLRNLFLTERMEVKIGDFGLAAQLQHPGDKRHTVCGTPNYIAPEIIGKQGHSYEVDIWALGIILYTILIGYSPFGTTEIVSTYKRIQSGVYEFPKDIHISREAKDLITRILNLNPFKRPTLDQILEHRFISGHSTPALMSPSTFNNIPLEPLVKQYSEPLLSINNNNHYMTYRSNRFTFKESSTGTWVKKWMEITERCGIGYLMSNGYYGVAFNDSSKLILCSNKR